MQMLRRTVLLGHTRGVALLRRSLPAGRNMKEVGRLLCTSWRGWKAFLELYSRLQHEP